MSNLNEINALKNRIKDLLFEVSMLESELDMLERFLKEHNLERDYYDFIRMSNSDFTLFRKEDRDL